MLFSISLFNVALFSMTLFNVALVSRTEKINIYYKCFFFEKYPSLYMLDIFLFYWWILVVVRKVRKYPHMCSSSLGAKGGGAVIRNGGGGEGKRVSWGVTLRPQFNTDPASQNISVWCSNVIVKYLVLLWTADSSWS